MQSSRDKDVSKGEAAASAPTDATASSSSSITGSKRLRPGETLSTKARLPTYSVALFNERYRDKPLTSRVNIQQPKEVNGMSRDSSHNWHIGSRASFATLELPTNFPVDLNQGFSRFKQTYRETNPDR